jgi:hypothetical protein
VLSVLFSKEKILQVPGQGRRSGVVVTRNGGFGLSHTSMDMTHCWDLIGRGEQKYLDKNLS